jgi:hypothetical protein
MIGWVLLSPEAWQQFQVTSVVLALGALWFMAGK